MRGRQVATRLTVAVLVLSLLVAPQAAGAPKYGLTDGQLSELSEQVLDRESPGEIGADSDTEIESIADLRAERARNRGVGDIGATRVHDEGITGEGVRVGVIDGGFEAGHTAIDDHVVDARSFDRHDSEGRIVSTHGTAVAEVVSDTAPGSDLYLADVGETPSADSYAEAVDWLLANDVDVIVDSGSYFTDASGDTSPITTVAENASSQGVVFVTSAGNYGDRHWAGSGALADDSGTVAEGSDAATDRSGWIAFDEHTEGNLLADGRPTRGEVSLRLRWSGEADYDLYLYRHLRNGNPRVVAKSVDRQAGNDSLANSESINVAVPRGTYYAAVYAHEANESARLRLFSIHQSLAHADARGSMVAPATSREVIAVGATGPNGIPREYSSLGAGDIEVDLSAPDGVQTSAAGEFNGTSAAAPYVAGTAALLEARNPGLSPTQVEAILEQTADERRSVDAYAAVRAASIADRKQPHNATV
ncbi:S8 family serine peptidase [Salinirubrum litoreum]|uniref:S8 family serine peptidase n=1 Tax=Salinirubrum litoreum TaxID=1126234 RepID=A0ABD5RBP5_9EURY|nr:S8 family serine peptidase [Salinirubrum litoreum]